MDTTYISAEGEIIAQVTDVILEQEDEALVEGVVFALHVGVAHRLAEDVFVEGAREVALEQLVVVDRLRQEAPDELEVAQVVRVAVRQRVDRVRHAIAR